MKSRYARSAPIFLCLLLFLGHLHGVAEGVIAYGVGARGSCGIYEVDFDTGSVNPLIDTPDIGWYGATDGDPRHPDTFYATPYGGSLYRVNVESHAVTAVGLNGYGGVPVNGLAYDEVHDILYATDYSNLYTIDITPGSPTEGMPTLIGEFKAWGESWALDYDALIDELVAMAQVWCGTKTYYIDRETGKADYVGFTRNKRITDIWYDCDSEQMFGVSNNPYWGTGKLYEIDPETGESTKISCIRYDLLGLGKPCDPVPEPATVIVLSLGGLLLRRRIN